MTSLVSARSFLVVVALSLIGCGGTGGTDGGDPEAAAAVVDGYEAQPAPIYIDGDGDDWSSVPVRQSDTGDGEGLALERLWVAHTERHLFLRVEVSRALNLQEGNDLTLYLDTDDNPETGRATLGLGAEVSWAFGDRAGTAYGDEVEHEDLGFHSLPTVESDVFELALDRSARPAGTPLFSGDSLRVALVSNGDRLPDEDGGLGYVLTDTSIPVESPSIDRPSGAAVRILSQNSVNDFDAGISAIFQADRQPSYRRVFDAIGPDVIAFQEIYEQSADTTETVMEGEYGLADEWNWAKRGQDLVLGSRFPIEDEHTIPGYEQNESGAFLLDARSALGERLIVVVMHPPCCNFEADEDDPSRNAQRQQVVDGVAAFLRRVTGGEGPFDVAPGTPIAVVGDMNFVGKAQQPRTLRTGEIVNTDRFGPSGAPDWDGGDLLDTNPRQTGAPLHSTWIDTTSAFPPGRLDYAFVTDSALEVVHEFILNTAALSEAERSAHGLEAGDTGTMSDHLPVVVDLKAN
jgi:endonuclease/exonuclease/phosphatase family metal-dependent hydrolase